MSTSVKRTGRRAVYHELRRKVIGLEYLPGAPLSENELAAELGVSRTPIREALIMLAQDDLVQVFPKIGSFVSRIDPQRVADAQFLRESVELASLDDLPEILDKAVLAELRENLKLQFATEDDREEFFRLDELFHQGLMRLSKHDGTWPAVVGAKAHLDRARRVGLQDQSLMPFAQQHTEILDAIIQGGTTNARALMTSHLRTIFADIEIVRERSPEWFAVAVGTPTRRSVAVWE